MATTTTMAMAGCSPKSLQSSKGELFGSSASYLSVVPKRPAFTYVAFVPMASRKCMLTGKKANNGWKISYSDHRTKHMQYPNLQRKRLWWESENTFVRLRICTQALRTIDKKGLEVMAKEAGLNLHDYICPPKCWNGKSKRKRPTKPSIATKSSTANVNASPK